MDNICPPYTQMTVFNNIVCNKKLYILPEYSHEPTDVKVHDLVFNWATGATIDI